LRYTSSDDSPFPNQFLRLPGGCSDAFNYEDDVDSSVVAHYNYKHLCVGSIAGVVIATGAVVGVVGVVGVVSLAGPAAGAAGAAGPYAAL